MEHVNFPDSNLAHKYLDMLKGIEIGGAAHNSFHLPNCINVDYTDDMNTVFKLGEEELCGEKMKVDVVAQGDDLPFEDESQDYVISSHVMEHFFDPIKALKEWYRVIKPGGFIFIIAPTHYSLAGETRPCTKLQELIDRHEGKLKKEDVDMDTLGTFAGKGAPMNEHGHWSVWDLVDFLPICEYLGYKVVESLEKDDKVRNGFCVVVQKS